jgi:hypothetical protein
MFLRELNKMKIRITMKTPDALREAIQSSIEEKLEDGELSESEVPFYEEELEAVKHTPEYSEILSDCKKWFRHGEFLTVEIDTHTNTCVVVRDK